MIIYLLEFSLILNLEDEMMEKLMSLDRKTVFINLFNIDNSATKEDISKFYEGVKILNILKNTGKQGNYDLLFESKEEAAKLISRGPGVTH